MLFLPHSTWQLWAHCEAGFLPANADYVPPRITSTSLHTGNPKETTGQRFWKRRVSYWGLWLEWAMLKTPFALSTINTISTINRSACLKMGCWFSSLGFQISKKLPNAAPAAVVGLLHWVSSHWGPFWLQCSIRPDHTDHRRPGCLSPGTAS